MIVTFYYCNINSKAQKPIACLSIKRSSSESKLNLIETGYLYEFNCLHCALKLQSNYFMFIFSLYIYVDLIATIIIVTDYLCLMCHLF